MGAQENDLFSAIIRQDNVSSIYTSGRKCNFKGKGCDAEHLQPINVNGWFGPELETLGSLLQMCPLQMPIGVPLEKMELPNPITTKVSRKVPSKLNSTLE